MNIHTCLDGAYNPGTELDCPRCRTQLLDAFRRPADAEEARRRHPSAQPHLIPPEKFSRMVELRPPAEPGPAAGTDAEHITEHGVDPDPDQPGGDWFARCSCGWSTSGHYARDGMGQRAAGRLAELRARSHRQHPDEETTA